MKRYERRLDLKKLLAKNSLFLFGPRGVGKSFLIRETLLGLKTYNLLDDEVFDKLMRRPKAIEEELASGTRTVVIDEIQKLPKLLDEVHRLIEERGIRFLLTGSSARKLRRGGANLLAGRAWESHLYPLIRNEIDQFSLDRYLNVGGLPRVYLSDEPREELKAYVRTYLMEEIKAEALVRSYERFVRFFEAIAQSNGKEINYQNLSKDSGVPVRTIEGYIEVLRDTLVGFELLPFTKTVTRKAVSRSKFYLFDVGVANYLKGLEKIVPASSDFGDAFEHFIITEVRAYSSYSRRDLKLQYWRSKDREVDLIFGSSAIEIKSTERIRDEDFKGLKALRQEKLLKNYFLVSRSKNEGVTDNIRYLHYETFLAELWAGKVS